jgi:copper homeostasis protein
LNIKLEICAFSLEWCQAAQLAGAHRVELCAGPLEGGTTPSAGLIQLVRELPNIELAVMVRPRAGDFLYDGTELATIFADINFARAIKANAIVLGVLNKKQQVDKILLNELVSHAGDTPVVFHRAIDVADNYWAAAETIMEAGCVRILTSGQKATAIEGIDNIEKLVKMAAGKIEIMAGSGVNELNAVALLDVGVSALHFSSRQEKPKASNSGIDFAECSNRPYFNGFLPNKVKMLQMANVIKQFGTKKNIIK